MTSKAIGESTRRHRILIVDDEEDVHRITQIALRKFSYRGTEVELLKAFSAQEALTLLRAMPDISVVLLDVVMESDHAGLHACRSIREELENSFVRILLRTGQPGLAPEEKVVQEYDIDGYLPKSELSSTRLVTMIRTALKAFDELTGLEARRKSLESVHESVRELTETSAWSEFGLDSHVLNPGVDR